MRWVSVGERLGATSTETVNELQSFRLIYCPCQEIHGFKTISKLYRSRPTPGSDGDTCTIHMPS